MGVEVDSSLVRKRFRLKKVGRIIRNRTTKTRRKNVVIYKAET